MNIVFVQYGHVHSLGVYPKFESEAMYNPKSKYIELHIELDREIYKYRQFIPEHIEYSEAVRLATSDLCALIHEKIRKKFVI
jgi:hypothetical protein